MSQIDMWGSKHCGDTRTSSTDEGMLMRWQDLAYVLATSYVATSILLSGFYIRTQDMKVALMRWLSYMSYTKYAMQVRWHCFQRCLMISSWLWFDQDCQQAT